MVFCSRSNSIAIIVAFLSVSFVGCGKTSDNNKSADSSKKLIMYQPSEMAVLMGDFYNYNQYLKAAIKNGDPLPEMPKEFLEIHTAKMTDVNGRTQAFQNLAPSFLAAQQRVADSLAQGDVIGKFNNAINMCIACHKTECVGPIPKIKKLYIE